MRSFNFIKLPDDRTIKPRLSGITSIIDKGLDLVATEQLLLIAADYMDVVKLGFGTARLYPEDILIKKIRLLKTAGINVCPGGTFFEIAYQQRVVAEYFKECQRLEFNCVEISDGVVKISDSEKEKLIVKAKKLGFTVFSEVGRKDSVQDQELALEQRVIQVQQQLDCGAWKVILEARESGNVGVFSQDTSVKIDDFNYMINAVNPENIIFEAPHKHQQIWLINQLGNLVNLANIAPVDVIALETLRLGLRADTMKT